MRDDQKQTPQDVCGEASYSVKSTERFFTPRSKKRLETSKHPFNGDSDIFVFESIKG